MVSLAPLERPSDTLFWAARPADDSDFTPEDPLALDYLAQQVGLRLFPALTTRTTRAQNYAVVLYGLHLAERALDEYRLPSDDDTRLQLFERWERFWALAVMESRNGSLERGDPDAMRGVLGVKRAWFAGDRPLGLDYPLISRQSELGGLGAYLSSLRAIKLVLPGDLRASPAAREILDAFWHEPGHGARIVSYDAYALSALDLKNRAIERKQFGVTLAAIGERTRLNCLGKRKEQQGRLYKILFEGAKDPLTFPLSELIRQAAADHVEDTEDFLRGALRGKWGALPDNVREHLVIARAFGNVFREMLSRFNAAYGATTRAGWIAPREQVIEATFPIATMKPLRAACSALLDAPLALELRKLPLHGGAFMTLASRLREASPPEAMDELLTYHRRVQQERRHGGGWLREDAGKIVVDLTTYTAHRFDAPFPSLKIPVVRRLLTDLGRIP